MDDVYSLLNIDAEALVCFPLNATTIDNLQTSRTINQNVRKLKQIEENFYVDDRLRPSTSSVSDVFNRFLGSVGRPLESSALSSHDLRIVSYYMAKLHDNYEAYMYAINVLDYKWKYLYLSGLVSYILTSWNLIAPPYRTAVCKLIQEKLRIYEGSNKRYIRLKNHLNFFDDGGPIRMAMLLLAKKEELFNAPMLIGYKPSTFSQSFYSDVVVEYLEKNKTKDLGFIESVLNANNLDRTKKLVLANLVVRAESEMSPVEQNFVAKLANRVLGDVSLATTWAPFVKATDADVARLKKAKQLINHWYARRIVEEFFDYIQDKDRKMFWLQYVEYVSDFRIVGSRLVRRTLQNNSKIADIFSNYFISTNSTMSQTSALILCIKNKVLIEFSDVGAMYAYNYDNPVLDFLRRGRRYIDSTNDLKSPGFDSLVDSYDTFYVSTRAEGRLVHRGLWQPKLKYWMSKRLIDVAVTGNYTFSQTKDEEIFKPDMFQDRKLNSITRSFTGVKKEIHSESKESDLKSQQFLPHHPIQTEKENHNSTIKVVKAAPYQELSLFDTTKKTEVKSKEPEGTCGIYVSDVKFKVASGWFFDSRCRVVLSECGFYFQLGIDRFVFIKLTQSREPISGIIAVKRSKSDKDWNEVIHQYGYLETRVGFVRFDEKENKIYYKETLFQIDSKFIELD